MPNNYDVGQLVAEIAIDTGEMKKGISDATNQLSRLESSIVQLNSNIQAQTAQMSASFGRVENTLKGLGTSLGGINSAIRQTASVTNGILTRLTGDFNTFAVESLVALNRLDGGFGKLSGVVQRSSTAMLGSMKTLENGMLQIMDAIIHQTDRMDVGFINMTRQLASIGSTGRAQLTVLENGFKQLNTHMETSIKELQKINSSLGNLNQHGNTTNNINMGFQRMSSSISGANEHGSNFFYTLSKISLMGYILMQDFRALGNVLQSVFGPGIEFAINMENTMIGMGAIITSSFKKADGSNVEFQEGLRVSEGILQSMKVAALESTATLQELMGTFQGIMGPAASLGMSMEEIKNFTVFGVNAVKSMGLKKDQMIQELRSIVSGNITARSSTVATALGITNTMIQEAKAQVGGVYAFLEERMKGFALAGEATSKTVSAIWSNIQDGLEQTQELAYEGLFSKIKKELTEVQGLFFQISKYKDGEVDDAGKAHKAGDSKVTLNPEVIINFRILANIVETIYNDIKRWATAFSNNSSSMDGLKGALNSVAGLIMTIYDNIDKIAGIFAIWSVATGGIKLGFLVLVSVAGRFSEVINFISNNIELMTVAMLTFTTATKIAGVALSVMSAEKGAGLAVGLSGAMGVLTGIVGILALAYTHFNGIDAMTSLITNHIEQIGVAMAGWAILGVVAQFGALYSAVVIVGTILAEIGVSLFGISSMAKFASDHVVMLVGSFAGLIIALNSSTIATAGLLFATEAWAIASTTALSGIIPKIVALISQIWGAIAVNGFWTISWGALAVSITTAFKATGILFVASIALVGLFEGLLWIIDKLRVAFFGKASAMDADTDATNRNTSATKKNTEEAIANARAKALADIYNDRVKRVLGKDRYDARSLKGDIPDEEELASLEKAETARTIATMGGLTTKFGDADGGGKGSSSKEASAERKKENLAEKIADQEAETQRKINLEMIKRDQKALEYQYANHLIGIETYYKKKIALEEKALAIETQALQSKIDSAKKHANEAEAVGDLNTALENNAEVRKLEGELTVKQIQNTEKLTSLNQELKKSYEDLDKKLMAVHASYLEMQGSFVESAKINFKLKNKDEMDGYTAIMKELEAKKALQGELSADDQDRYNKLQEYFILNGKTAEQAVLEGKIKEEQIVSDKVLYELQQKKAKISRDLSDRLVTDMEAKQLGYDADKKALEESETSIKAQIAHYEDLYEASNKTNLSYKKSADTLRQTLAELKHPLTAFQESIKTSFGDGLEKVIDGLIMKTKSFKDLLQDLGNSIKQTVSTMISQQITKGILASIYKPKVEGADTTGKDSTTGVDTLTNKIKTSTVPAMNNLSNEVDRTTEAFKSLERSIESNINSGGGSNSFTPSFLKPANNTKTQDFSFSNFNNILGKSSNALTFNVQKITEGTNAVSNNSNAFSKLTFNSLSNFGSALGKISGSDGLGKFGSILSSLGGLKLGKGKGFLGLFSSGGYVSGEGTATSDSINARLSNGEYVTRASVVSKLGKGFFDNLNEGRLPEAKFATGGYVGVAPNTASTNAVGEIKIEIINQSGKDVKATKTETKIDGVNTVISLWIEGVSNNVLNSQDMIKSMGGRN